MRPKLKAVAIAYLLDHIFNSPSYFYQGRHTLLFGAYHYKLSSDILP